MFTQTSRLSSLLTATLAALVGLTVLAVPAQAQTNPTKSKPTVAKKASKKKASVKRKTTSRATRKKSDAERRSDAYRRLQDYNYVKSMSPFAGSSTKW